MAVVVADIAVVWCYGMMEVAIVVIQKNRCWMRLSSLLSWSYGGVGHSSYVLS
jgi:hypothetical protein